MCFMLHVTDEERTCAELANLGKTPVLEFYQTNSESPKFVDYLDCVFLKWNFTTPTGSILFDNIIVSRGLAWKMSRMCEDTFSLIIELTEEFKKSAIFCKENPPSVLSPFTVRKCISENYRLSSRAVKT
ncbi:hypothetical protein PPYR_01019 [Photinus pyralis]|nr:hypothetical protein PPYR_01019 [Photinus pyralis]